MKVTQDQLVELLSLKAANYLGLGADPASCTEAIVRGLRLILATVPAPAGVQAQHIYATAEHLSQARGSFTMDELLDEAFRDQPVYSPHKVKIYAAQVLRPGGSERRQFRRAGERPLLWFRPVGSLEE